MTDRRTGRTRHSLPNARVAGRRGSKSKIGKIYMPARKNLLRAVAKLGVPLDPDSALLTEEKLYLLAEVADRELLEVSEFFGIALLAAVAVVPEGKHVTRDHEWLQSAERDRIEKFFRSLPKT